MNWLKKMLKKGLTIVVVIFCVLSTIVTNVFAGGIPGVFTYDAPGDWPVVKPLDSLKEGINVVAEGGKQFVAIVQNGQKKLIEASGLPKWLQRDLNQIVGGRVGNEYPLHAFNLQSKNQFASVSEYGSGSTRTIEITINNLRYEDVTLNGTVKVINPRVKYIYSLDGPYEAILFADIDSNVKASYSLKKSVEKDIPLFAFAFDFDGILRGTAGFVFRYGYNANLQIDMQYSNFSHIATGVQGECFAGNPITARLFKDFYTRDNNFNVQLKGNLGGKAGICGALTVTLNDVVDFDLSLWAGYKLNANLNYNSLQGGKIDVNYYANAYLGGRIGVFNTPQLSSRISAIDENGPSKTLTINLGGRSGGVSLAGANPPNDPYQVGAGGNPNDPFAVESRQLLGSSSDLDNNGSVASAQNSVGVKSIGASNDVKGGNPLPSAVAAALGGANAGKNDLIKSDKNVRQDIESSPEQFGDDPFAQDLQKSQQPSGGLSLFYDTSSSASSKLNPGAYWSTETFFGGEMWFYSRRCIIDLSQAASNYYKMTGRNYKTWTESDIKQIFMNWGLKDSTAEAGKKLISNGYQLLNFKNNILSTADANGGVGAKVKYYVQFPFFGQQLRYEIMPSL